MELSVCKSHFPGSHNVCPPENKDQPFHSCRYQRQENGKAFVPSNLNENIYVKLASILTDSGLTWGWGISHTSLTAPPAPNCWDSPLRCGGQAFGGKVIFRYFLLKSSKPEDYAAGCFQPAVMSYPRASSTFQAMLLVCQIADCRGPSEGPSGPSYTWGGPGVDLPPAESWRVFNRRICEIMTTMLAFYVFVCKIMGFRLNWGRCANAQMLGWSPCRPSLSNIKP